MAATGNYITDTDLTNWAIGATDAEKQTIIDRVERRIELITKDYFYPRKLDIYRDGNGGNRLHLNLFPDILYISDIDISGVELTSSYWTWDDNAIYLDEAGTSGSEAELRWLLRQYVRSGIFPYGINNVRVQGTMGWPEKLDYDAGVGTFVAEETITGGTSGATARIKEVFTTYLLIVGRSTTDFDNNEEITGGTSDATADVDNASGAINNPPESIIEACIKLCEYENDETLYNEYIEGSEGLSTYSYTGKTKPLAGIREVDQLLRDYVRKKPMIGIV